MHGQPIIKIYCVMSNGTVIFIAKIVLLLIFTFTVLLLSRKITQNCRGPIRPYGPSIYVAMSRW
jgi:hypothetical protein